jgi:hypothetical protein
MASCWPDCVYKQMPLIVNKSVLNCTQACQLHCKTQLHGTIFYKNHYCFWKTLLSNNHVFILLPGTEMHTDPASTDAYNTMIVGHKAWAFLPRDMYEFRSDWSCDAKCSPRMNKLNNAAFWIHNMLPQIRSGFTPLFATFLKIISVRPLSGQNCYKSRNFKPLFLLGPILLNFLLKHCMFVHFITTRLFCPSILFVSEAWSQPLKYNPIKGSNRTAHIRHLCRKTTVLRCHRCLISTGVVLIQLFWCKITYTFVS